MVRAATRAAAVAAVVLVSSTGVEAAQPPPPIHGLAGVTLSSVELAGLLAERDAELKALKAKLELLDEGKWLDAAEDSGVLAALDRSGFTERQKQRVAVAIVRNAQANGVDPLLVVAVIHCESSFNPYAVSGPGAMGLMQVMPDTGKWLADQRGFALRKTDNLFDFELNVELGTAYLASLIEKFGSIEHALVAYNAGPAAAKKILAQREVRKKFVAGYPAKVVREMRKLQVQATRMLEERGNTGSTRSATAAPEQG